MNLTLGALTVLCVAVSYQKVLQTSAYFLLLMNKDFGRNPNDL